MIALKVLVVMALGFALSHAQDNLTNYGKWCGKARTGIWPWVKPGYCKCDDPKETCRKNYPPRDDLDSACLDHDYCAQCDNTHNFFRFCHCEKGLVENTAAAKCVTDQCRGFRDRLLAMFHETPCYCKPRGKICKTWWFVGDNDYCLVKNYRECK
ncbi:uncharacterized protein LOC135497324 isoform X1 [Lineus longissimus]|uniref:uncharacterized protein LOC135497324 isoform X1 n=1 Tax=Lineus longissimus TaxID=88925 RepID=UPI002B4F2A24